MQRFFSLSDLDIAFLDFLLNKVVLFKVLLKIRALGAWGMARLCWSALKSVLELAVCRIWRSYVDRLGTETGTVLLKQDRKKATK
jgi:hypothetical protein